MKGFSVPSQMMGVRAMVDGGVGLSFHTKELDKEEKASIMDFHMSTGWLLFSPNEIAESDVPSLPADREVKTPSQRLRAVIYIHWEQSDKRLTFEQFYTIKMESIINSIKSKLDN